MKNCFFILLLLIPSVINSQGPGIATNPNPADSSVNVFWFYQNISWTNPSNATNVKVFVGIHPDFITELYHGAIINSFQIPSPLEIRKTYYWRIDEIDSTGTSEGNVWSFTTKNSFDYIFIDSFSIGLTNWAVTNSNDSCSWKVISIDSIGYDLPPTAGEYAVCSDNKLCSNERVINVMELTNPPDLSIYTRCGIGWDNDLLLDNYFDTAYVEVSNNGGINWERVWIRQGRSQRKSQERIWLGFRFSWNLRVRFRSSFEGQHSWWVIDNFFVFGSALTYFPEIPPNNLSYNLNLGDSLNVLINWQQAFGPPSVDRYRIQKKLGDSLSQFAYFTIGETDLNTFSFLDTKVKENVEYSYRVGICEGPLQGWNSLPLTLLVPPLPVELTTFYATIEDNNVTLYWETSTETNNKGFEVLRKVAGGEFIAIAFVEGKGTTTQNQTYSYSDRSLTYGVYSYRLKQVDLDGTVDYSNITEVEIAAPLSFDLAQNYPNPFNLTTTISYALPFESDVSVTIYDLTGRIIRTFNFSNQSAGSKDFLWDGMNDNGVAVSSGVYICMFRALSLEGIGISFIKSMKLMLLK